MRHALIATLVAVMLSAVVAPPAPAARAKARLRPPVAVSDTSVRLHGKVSPARHRVRLQTRRHGHWRLVERLRVRHGRFSTEVDLGKRARRYRVVAGHRHSRARTVAARQPTDACGVRPERADGSEWSCTFADDFDGNSLDRADWQVHTDFAPSDLKVPQPCFLDDPDNVAVRGGALRLTVRKVAQPVTCLKHGRLSTRYTSGMVSTYHRFSQRYGRFEARLKVEDSEAPGLQESFWLWPDDRDHNLLEELVGLLWPAAGEIDVVETYSQFAKLAIPFLHYTWNDNGGQVPGLNTAYCNVERGRYNTYTLEWTAKRLTVMVNGDTCLVNKSGNIAFRRKYIVAFTQGLGLGTNALTAKTPVPATTSVDYVHVWK